MIEWTLGKGGLASLPFWVGHPQMGFHHGKREAYEFSTEYLQVLLTVVMIKSLSNYG